MQNVAAGPVALVPSSRLHGFSTLSLVGQPIGQRVGASAYWWNRKAAFTAPSADMILLRLALDQQTCSKVKRQR